MGSFLILPPLLLLTVAAVSCVTGGFSNEFAAWPFAIALVVVGLPHGAVDLRLAAKMEGVSLVVAATRFGWYVLLMCGVVFCLWLFPAATLVGFAVLSAWHFGRADVEDQQSVAEHKNLPFDRVEHSSSSLTASLQLAAWSRGLLILALPFCFHVEQSIDVAETLVRFCGAGLSSNISSIERIATVVACVCGSFELLKAVWLLTCGHVRMSRLILLESASLVFAFWALHPMFAMGLYFGCWHSWRHLRRLNSVLCPNLNLGLKAILRLHLESLPLLLPTLAMICLMCVQFSDGVSVENAAFMSLLVYAVVTLPHEFLCNRLFRFLAHVGSVNHIPLGRQFVSRSLSPSSLSENRSMAGKYFARK